MACVAVSRQFDRREIKSHLMEAIANPKRGAPILVCISHDPLSSDVSFLFNSTVVQSCDMLRRPDCPKHVHM